MNREKMMMDVVQGLICIVKEEQRIRENMQTEIDKLICEIAELRTETFSGRAK